MHHESLDLVSDQARVGMWLEDCQMFIIMCCGDRTMPILCAQQLRDPCWTKSQAQTHQFHEDLHVTVSPIAILSTPHLPTHQRLGQLTAPRSRVEEEVFS